jgi:hypothetical protein
MLVDVQICFDSKNEFDSQVAAEVMMAFAEAQEPA